MDEHTNQDIQEDDNHAPTGSQSTRPPRRQRGAHGSLPRHPQCPTASTANGSGRIDTEQAAWQADVATLHPQLPRMVSRTGKARKDRSTRRRSRAGCAQGPVARGSTPRKHPSSQPRPETILIYRRLGREASVDKPAERENHNQSRLDHLQRQLDLLIGQQCGLEPPGSADPLFTPSIMASPYPSRFKMPTIPSYDGFTDADEYLENYQTHMLIQSANEAALCKSFCLTLTGVALQWYQRLPPASIDSFQQLVNSFSTAFLGSRTRKLGASHLFGIKQRENKKLKKYLERFDKVVVQVEDCTDDTLTQALREGINDPRLVWTLAYARPTSFTHLRVIAWRHAEADEYVRGRGLEVQDQERPSNIRSERDQPRNSDQNRQDKGKNPVVETRAEADPSPRMPTGRFRQYTPLVTMIEHVLNQVFGRGLLRDLPPIRTDRSRRNQNKYCHFHKDVGHDIKDCIQLRDQIELLFHEGHLWEFVEKIITPAGQGNRAAPAAQDTASSRRSYAREARRFVRGEYINMAEHISKMCRQDSPPITFTDDEADRLLHPHNDALVGEIRVANNVVRRVLIDSGSSADVMFMDAFSRLKIEGATLTPAKTPLYGFVRDCVRAAGTVRLPVTIDDGPLHLPPRQKFPTGNGIGVFRGNQEGARKCYMEAVTKVCWKAPAPATVATILAVDEAGVLSGEVKHLADLDPRMPEEEIRALPLEDLIPFQLDLERPERTNAEADVLAWLVSGNDLEGLVSFPIEKLDQPSIDREEMVIVAESTQTWMDPIARYLADS
ncbi:hypothetical protein TIFTF001_036596 [Ficus carica]|uniref:Retrotransposon gag domain-containing protein n=1 Tax=Ficus carica TaxID=3494 RepID=A0AA88JCX0_FICCA|nr:hypothetical protein TIFTF001_036596 [Ficus carica]